MDDISSDLLSDYGGLSGYHIFFFLRFWHSELVTAQTHQTDCLAQKAALEHTVKDYSRQLTSLCVARLRERKQLALPRGGSSL